MSPPRLALTSRELDPYLRKLSPERQYSSRRYRYGVKDGDAALDTVVILKLLVEDWLEGQERLSDDITLSIMMEFDFQPVADAFEAKDNSQLFHLAIHDWKFASLPAVRDKFLKLSEDFPWIASLPAPAVTILVCDLSALLWALEATHARVTNQVRQPVQGDTQAPT